MIIIKVKLIYHTCSKSQILKAVLDSKKESIDSEFANGILKLNYRKKWVLSSNFRKSLDHDYYMKKISQFLPNDIIGIEIKQFIQYKTSYKFISYYQNGTVISVPNKITDREIIYKELEKQKDEDKKHIQTIIKIINLNLIYKE